MSATAATVLATVGLAGGTGLNPASGSVRPWIEVGNDPWGSSYSLNYFSGVFLGYGTSYMTLLPLAIVNPEAGLTGFKPQLATSWSLSGHTLVVNLRHGVVWQDGPPVTSTDVIDTVLLDGVNGNAVWQGITGVRAPNKYQVDFTLLPSVSTVNAEDDVFDNVIVVSAQQYGQFVTPGLAKEVETYYAAQRANPATAAKTPAGKAVSALDTKLLAYKPTTIIGDGPFELKAVTTAEAELVKSPTFYGAKNVHIPEILWEEASAASNAGEMLSGAADYSWTGFTWPVYQRELAQGIHIVTPPNWAQFDLFFNNRKYPLNMVQVRQAIAYIVHRKSLQVLADGGHTWYSYVQHPSGLYDANELNFVTKAQLDSLNTYPYDPAKAAHLLESVGFKKVNGKWMMPNGKPFTLTFGGPEGWTGPTAVVRIAAGWLTQFGIPTTGSAVEQPGYWTYQQEGNFDLDWGWGGFAVNPLSRMAYDLGYNLNFSNAGTYKGDPGIGFGPIETVPGIGKVNVPATISAEAGTASGATLDKLTWDWAKFINTELPVLPFYDKNIPFQYSTRTYTDWPPKTSPVWAVMGYSIPAGVALMAEEGYVRPAS